MDINKLIADYSKLGKDDYFKALTDKLNKILPEISKYSLNQGGHELPGLQMFGNIVIATLWADHEVTGTEIGLLTSILQQTVDAEIDFEDCKQFVVKAASNLSGYQSLTDAIIDTIGSVNKALKEDIVTACLLITLIDGKVTDAEKAFLETLLA